MSDIEMRAVNGEEKVSIGEEEDSMDVGKGEHEDKGEGRFGDGRKRRYDGNGEGELDGNGEGKPDGNGEGKLDGNGEGKLDGSGEGKLEDNGGGRRDGDGNGEAEDGEGRGDVEEEERHLDTAKYGGYKGPNAMFLRLISSDGHEFYIKKKYALSGSSTLVRMVEGGPRQYAEDEPMEVNLREIPSHVLRKVCIYFVYKAINTGSECSVADLPMPEELAPEVLLAANFLEC